MRISVLLLIIIKDVQSASLHAISAKLVASLRFEKLKR